MTDLASPTFSSRSRIIAYWATTALVVSELAVGGVWDILRVPLDKSEGVVKTQSSVAVGFHRLGVRVVEDRSLLAAGKL